jgi:uncharacterized protein YndB with AHSA1/START domain
MERAERAIEIDAPVERVFELLSDFEGFPRWMRGIREVRRVGRRATRWRAETAAGEDAVWVAETTVFEPDHRLAWRSLEGDVEADGELILQETRRGTTLLRAVVGYGTPGGRSGAASSRFFGRNPERQLDEDLARFRRLAERHAEGVRRSEEEERELDEEEERRRRMRAREDDDAERAREDERREYRPSRALTPRERARVIADRRESFERAPERDYTETLRRRGVDRLLDDDAPSRNWRRRD